MTLFYDFYEHAYSTSLYSITCIIFTHIHVTPCSVSCCMFSQYRPCTLSRLAKTEIRIMVLVQDCEGKQILAETLPDASRRQSRMISFLSSGLTAGLGDSSIGGSWRTPPDLSADATLLRGDLVSQ